MTFSKLTAIILILLFCGQVSMSQKKDVKKDSLKIYKKIEVYANKNKINKFFYRLLFRSTNSNTNDDESTIIINNGFKKHEGKIIREIRIETLDPFGYSSSNDLREPKENIEKIGNRLHIKTKKWTIQNSLLFKKNQPLDSLIAKESERLIRSQRYIRSVVIKPIEILNCKDSVDISIRVLDSWSLLPSGAISSSKGNLEITERNVLGFGHEVENNFTREFNDGTTAENAKYTINNIKNTFIKSTFFYQNDLDNNTTRSAKIERPFFSPLTKNAAGVFFENKFYLEELPDSNNIFSSQKISSQTQQFWIGHSFKILRGKSRDDRFTNLISSVGYKQLDYMKKPEQVFDSSNFFESEKLYLATIGINTRKFTQDKYLFNFGIIEDVPYGKVFAFTGGFQEKNYIKRAYFSGRIAYGNYFKFGYASANIEWGGFNSNGITEETTLRIEANYFTNLISIRNLKIRQFIKPTFVQGNNRLSSIKDRVSFFDQNGISGFNNPLINGTKKVFTSFQTQTYVTGNWHGFHFSPFLNISIGALGDTNDKFFKDTLYSTFSIGALINNDYLVFNSFQISFSYYPSIPFEGNNVIKPNTLKNNDLSLPDFQIGEPTIVPFR